MSFLIGLLPLTLVAVSDSASVGSPREGFRRFAEQRLSSTITAETSGRVTLVLESPVLPLDPSLDPHQPLGRQMVSALLNHAFMPELSATYGIETVPSAYQKILEFHESPNSPFDIVKAWRRSKANRILFEPVSWWSFFLGLPSDRERTPEYKQYLIYLQQKSQLLQSSPSPEQIKTFDDSWKTSGYKDRIERARLEIQQNSFPFDEAWWHDVAQRYEVNLEYLSSLSFAETFSSPSYDTWKDNSGWVALQYNPDATKLLITMEVKLAQISRPWLDPAVFTSRAWKWQPNAVIPEPISTGFSDNGDLPHGLMPLLPQSVLLARNIHVSGTLASSLRSDWLLPTGDETVILGWFCELVPRTPDPDSKYHFSKD